MKRLDGKPAKKMALKRYRFQKQRGQEGFGFVSVEKGILTNLQRSKDEEGIEAELEKDTGTEILFHHRFPTSTANFLEATHPIFVRHEDLKYDYYVVHNGVIRNDDVLKKQHEEMGFAYTTSLTKKWISKFDTYISHFFNDSESLAIEVALAIEGAKKTIDAEGSIAFIAMQVDPETREVIATYYGRNYSNPLKLNEQSNFISLTSEGSGEMVPADKLFRLDEKTSLITVIDLEIGRYHYSPPSQVSRTEADRLLKEYQEYQEDEAGTGYFPLTKRRESLVPALPSGSAPLWNQHEDYDEEDDLPPMVWTEKHIMEVEDMIYELEYSEELLIEEVQKAKDTGLTDLETEKGIELQEVQAKLAQLEALRDRLLIDEEIKTA